MRLKSILCHFFPHKFVKIGDPHLVASKRYENNVCVVEGVSTCQWVVCSRCGYWHTRYGEIIPNGGFPHGSR